MREDDPVLREFMATLLPPSPPPSPFQLESVPSKLETGRKTEYRIPRFAGTVAHG